MNLLESLGHNLLAFNAVAKGAKIDEKYVSIMDEKVVHEECFDIHDRYLYFYKQHKILNRLLSKINVKDFDVIHSHTLFNGGWVVYKIKSRFNIPYVVSVRNTDLNDFLKFPFFIPVARKITREAYAIMFLSEAYKIQFLKKVYGKSVEEQKTIRDKCYVIPNGLEEFWLDNIGPSKELRNSIVKLICVGKIDHNKNMKSIIDAMEILKKEGVPTKLTVIGQVVDNDVLDILKKCTDVELVSYQTKENLIHYYRESDIFVMPSYTESFGRVYAEAMTQGVPVIYTRNQGFDGFFPEGEVGYSVDSHNPATIADAINNIIKNYNSISANCINKCSIFNWTTIAKDLEVMYQEAVGRKI
jgi:glycosyltransferase involved in cell wall biosynthesis